MFPSKGISSNRRPFCLILHIFLLLRNFIFFLKSCFIDLSWRLFSDVLIPCIVLFQHHSPHLVLLFLKLLKAVSILLPCSYFVFGFVLTILGKKSKYICLSCSDLKDVHGRREFMMLELVEILNKYIKIWGYTISFCHHLDLQKWDVFRNFWKFMCIWTLMDISLASKRRKKKNLFLTVVIADAHIMMSVTGV